MVADEEGFLYPKVNEELCINCGKCVKSCPILTPKKADKSEKDILAYGAYNKDDNIRLKSSSGGIFTALAEKIINEGGVVFGAAFDDFNVIHTSAKSIEELEKFRGSKYVQSKIGNTYREAKDLLDQGITVYFSGTPCQISGLYSFLDKDYDNLITQDIICHGVPSPLVWKKYLEFQTVQAKEMVEDAQFRNKKFGWKNFSMFLKFKNGTEYISSHGKDFYMQAFLKNYCLRPSCYSCSFKGLIKQSDVTLADFWGIEKTKPSMDDDKGISLVWINSKKGCNVFRNTNDNIVFEKVDLSESLKYNSSAVQSVGNNKKREKFLKVLQKRGFKNASKILFKKPLKANIKSFLKKLLNK